VKTRLADFELRSFVADDAESLAAYADNRKVWLNLRDGFPHPYTIDHAREFIDRVTAQQPGTVFCIAIEGRASGGIGLSLHQDVERFSAELGYWLAEPFWGRGIMTRAVEAVCRHAFDTHGLKRIYAMPYAWNPASCRVLEKAGFTREGRLQASAFKDGRFVDQLLYARVVDSSRAEPHDQRKR